jgi:hypothetical protein
LLAKELGGSVLLGGLLGALIIAYVRFVGAEMLLFVAGLVLAAAELSKALHLDLLLVFIAAGFTVRNASSNWKLVLHALETVALPVYVVFFTIAGARIDVRATLAVLPLALLLSALRAGGFYAAARVGARVGRESEEVKRLAWQAYLPQAGVTLGLLGLAVESLGGELGKALSDLGIACVAVNLAIGPVTLRRALQLSTRAPAVVPGRESSNAGAPPNGVLEAVNLPALRLQTGSQQLDGVLQGLHDELIALIADVRRDHLRAHAHAMVSSLVSVFEAEDRHGVVQRLLAFASAGQATQVAQRAQLAGIEDQTTSIWLAVR